MEKIYLKQTCSVGTLQQKTFARLKQSSKTRPKEGIVILEKKIVQGFEG